MKIPLSPMDYYFYRRKLYTIQFVFEYKGEMDTENLVRALQLTIQCIPAISSRIKIISKSEIVLETGYPLALEERTLNNETPEPIQTNDYLLPIENRENEPLIKVLVTQTPTRTFAGFSFSHMLGDGASFFKFIHVLSKICCSQEVTVNASNERQLLHIDPCSTAPCPSLFDSTGYVIPRPDNPADFQIENLRFSNQDLKKQIKDFKNQGINVSSNDILMAKLAKRFHKDIPLYEDQFIVRCPVDYRKIFGLPQDYFGNAVRDAVSIFTPNEIEQMSLADVALRIRQSIHSIDKNSVLKSLRALDYHRKTEGIDIFENMGCPGLLVSNLSKFPIQKIDLGMGAPTCFYHGSFSPRLSLILPATDGVVVRFKKPSSKAQVICSNSKLGSQ